MLNETANINKKNEITSTILKHVRENYYIFIGLLFMLIGIVNYFSGIFPLEYNGFVFLAAFTSFTVLSDVNTETKAKTFLLMAVPYMVIILIVFANGNDLWHGVLRWQLQRNVIFNMNKLFDSIPFNDASFARIFHPTWLTSYMKIVYNTGFVLAVVVPLFRAALSMNFKKMLKYTLSGHVFQVFIITPFYIVFFLQEVWYVHGHPDMLARNLNPAQMLETTVNCFPSMHTSIAFAMFLLVLREKDKLFKWIWGIYCLSVIYSTMYLEIHWVIDVIGGLILGYCTVKLVDFVIAKTEVPISKRFNNLINKDDDKIAYEE